MNELIFKWRLPLFNLRLFLGKAGNLASNKTFVDFDLNSIRWSCHLFCSTVYLQSSCWYNQCISWSSSIIYSLNNIFWVSYNSVILWKRDNNLSFVKDPGTSVYDNYLALIFRYGCSYHLIGKHKKSSCPHPWKIWISEKPLKTWQGKLIMHFLHLYPARLHFIIFEATSYHF